MKQAYMLVIPEILNLSRFSGGLILGGPNLDDWQRGVLLLQPLDVRSQLQGLLVVTVPDAGVHQLGDLQDLQDLSVSVQRQAVHSPAGPDLLRLLHEPPG